MDKLLARCQKHRENKRGKKRRKSTHTSQRNTSKTKQHVSTTTQAQQPLTQTINQPKKVPQIESSGQLSTTKHPKTDEQAQKEQTSIGNNPAARTIPAQRTASKKITNISGKENEHKENEQQEIGNIPGQRDTPVPGAFEQVPGNKKREREKGESGNGLTSIHALTLAKKNASSANKLTSEQRQHIYQLLAAGYRNSTILAHIRVNLGVKVSRQSINQMRHRHPERVEQGRREVESEITLAAPIASKLHRIAKRQELINSLERKLWRVTSVTKDGTRLLTGTHETINRILDSVKVELEPYEVNVNIDLKAQTAQQYRDVSSGGVISEAMSRLKEAGMEIAQVVKPEPDK